MMELIHVTPKNLRSHWASICESLAVVHKKTAPEWIAEDIYHEIKAGQVICYRVFEGGAPVALFILEDGSDDRGRGLHIKIAHNLAGPEAFDYGLDAIRNIAKGGGATRLTLESPRLGWSKRFRLVSATYEVPLE